MIASMAPTTIARDHEQTNEHQSLRCSFCGKGHDDVRKLIASPTANICDECVTLCAELIAAGLDEPAAYEPRR
jgi:hypothetical protein